MSIFEKPLKDALDKLIVSRIEGVLEEHRMYKSIRQHDQQTKMEMQRGYLVVTTPDGKWVVS